MQDLVQQAPLMLSSVFGSSRPTIFSILLLLFLGGSVCLVPYLLSPRDLKFEIFKDNFCHLICHHHHHHHVDHHPHLRSRLHPIVQAVCPVHHQTVNVAKGTAHHKVWQDIDLWKGHFVKPKQITPWRHKMYCNKFCKIYSFLPLCPQHPVSWQLLEGASHPQPGVSLRADMRMRAAFLSLIHLLFATVPVIKSARRITCSWYLSTWSCLGNLENLKNLILTSTSVTFAASSHFASLSLLTSLPATPAKITREMRWLSLSVTFFKWNNIIFNLFAAVPFAPFRLTLEVVENLVYVCIPGERFVCLRTWWKCLGWWWSFTCFSHLLSLLQSLWKFSP